MATSNAALTGFQASEPEQAIEALSSERISSRERSGSGDVHPLLRRAFAALEQARVRWCLLRLPADAARPSGDVDLLVDRVDLAVARAALDELQFARLPGVGSGAEHMFFSYHPQTDHWLCLHIVSALGFGPGYELETHAEATCLARARWDAQARRLDPADEFWVTLLHCLLDKGSVQERRRAGLRQLANESCTDSPLAEVIARVCPAQWTPGRLLQCVAQEAWDTLAAAAPVLAAAWRERMSPLERAEILLRRLARFPARLVQALRRRGLSMAVLGPDGAGKSTLADGIRTSFCRPVRTIYMGFGGGGKPPLLTRLRLPGIGAPGHLLVMWWRTLHAQLLRLQGYLVIFDRYSYDTLAASPEHARNWLSRLGSWVKAHWCPAPSLIIVLDAPGALMFERKGELKPAILEAQRQKFLALRERFPQVRVVDATQAPNAVRVEVLTHLWQRYRRHWS